MRRGNSRQKRRPGGLKLDKRVDLRQEMTENVDAMKPFAPIFTASTRLIVPANHASTIWFARRLRFRHCCVCAVALTLIDVGQGWPQVVGLHCFFTRPASPCNIEPLSMKSRSRTRSARTRFPLATVAAYGPDTTLATKLVVSVFERARDSAPSATHTWTTEAGDVRLDPAIAAEVTDFVERHHAKQTISAERIMGCPHEEGIDYPMGRTCPRCPFWAGLDRLHPRTGDARSADPRAGRDSG